MIRFSINTPINARQGNPVGEKKAHQQEKDLKTPPLPLVGDQQK